MPSKKYRCFQLVN